MFTYPLGNSPEENLLSCYELKHTFVNALFAIVENDPDLKEMPEVSHLMSLYHEAHFFETQLLRALE